MDVVDILFNPDLVWDYRHEIWSGFLTTLALAGVTFAISLVPSLLVALARTYGPPAVRWPLFVFVTFVRAIPSIVLVVFVFFALPFAGVFLSGPVSIVFTLSLVFIAYNSEVFRAGLLSVGQGQFDAAYSVGLRRRDVLMRVVFPQAFKVAAPAFTSSIVILFQYTTIASVVAVGDLVGVSLSIQAKTGSPAPLVVAGVLYLVILLPLVRIVRRMERRSGHSRAGAA
jgi:polar amino acid transport system permease protein